MNIGEEIKLEGDELEVVKRRFETSNSYLNTIASLSEVRLQHDNDTWALITEKHPDIKNHKLTFHHPTGTIIVMGHELKV